MKLQAPLLSFLLAAISASGFDTCEIVALVGEFPVPVCAAQAVRDFASAAGDAVDLLQLPRAFQYCLSHYARPVAPACTNV
jgi:hypothetical protein